MMRKPSRFGTAATASAVVVVNPLAISMQFSGWRAAALRRMGVVP